MTESDLQRLIMIEASKTGARLFRNQVGQGWYGDWEWLGNSRTDIIIRNARPLKAGICVGSGDLIGWNPQIITADMIGQQVAIFTSIEVKSKRGRLTAEQGAFFNAVHGAGGIGIIARSVEDVLEALK